MNNKCKLLIVLSLIFMVATTQVQAERYKGDVVAKKSPKNKADCFPPAKTTELSFNAVRAHIKTNGTMWNDAGQALYEIPKGDGHMSLYSASLWVAGMKGSQLYVAAMRFGQIGNDYYTGPLSMIDGETENRICATYDRFYKISRVQVERHLAAMAEEDTSYEPPKEILDWPGNGNVDWGHSKYLAPFVNMSGDGIYDPNPLAGRWEYPYYDLQNELCPWTTVNKEKAKQPYWSNWDSCTHNPEALPLTAERQYTCEKYNRDNFMIAADHVLKGDETIYWFLNDKGNVHTETGGMAIGLEIRVQAFAFATNDELNNMTFYSYEIINRGTNELTDCYFSQWCDPDLGYAWDDFVGCDVIRGMGYCYNGEEVDGNGQPEAYGANPPAVGLDFFQGPYIDPDGSDNPKFKRNFANITGNSNEQEYCRKFVHHIFDYWKDGAPELLSDTHPTETIIVEEIDTLGNVYFDTVPLRWNNQFAINGVNFGDGIVDNERFGMRAFTYHSNTSGPTGDPSIAIEYYNYLRGFWKNGRPFTYGGTGYSEATDGILCKFVFPEGTDFCNWGTQGTSPGENYNGGGRAGNWSERMPNGTGSSPNKPDDRRFMQSAGPFTLKQGACNYVTVGVPWARATQGTVEASITLLKVADDKCQALFENCFKILDGPDAPTLTIREYDRKLIFLLTNSPLSNNYREKYIEEDTRIPELAPWDSTLYLDRNYRFQGYQIFQVAGPGVGAIDLENTSLARLVRQYDIEDYDGAGNPIGRLINWEFDEDLQISVPKEKVNGSNSGIEHSFEVTTDLFATGDRQLVNYKTYYFIAVAYAYNNFWPYSDDPLYNENNEGLYGQKLPYLRGRKTAEGGTVVAIPGIPHPPTVHGGGNTLNSEYGSLPIITRLDGQGNGGIALDLSKETIQHIISGGDNNDYRARVLRYEKNAGPLLVKVVDPLRVKPFDYILQIKHPLFDLDSIVINGEKVPVSEEMKNRADVEDDAYWVLTIPETVSDQEIIDAGFVDKDGLPIREVFSESTIGARNEQLIIPLGISITITNADFITTDSRTKTYWWKILREYNNDMYRIKTAFMQPSKIDVANDIVFENNGPQWITGLVDDNDGRPSNWIRAGADDQGNNWDDSNTQQVKNRFELVKLEDFHFPSVCLIPDAVPGSTRTIRGHRSFKDPSGQFGTICGGTWAPYVLTSPYDGGPQAKYTKPEYADPNPNESEQSVDSENPWFNSTNGTNVPVKDGLGLYNYYKFEDLTDIRNQPGYNQTMINLYSVDVVLTPNKDLWTRCVVLEACNDFENSEGNALKNEPRKALSVGKDGKPDGSKDGFYDEGKYGMGWFPGYAINLETGERLNIMFSENSDVTLQDYDNLINGRDMVFNPTSTYAIATWPIELDIPGLPITKIQPGDVIPKNVYDLFGKDFAESIGIVRVLGGMHYVYVCGSSGNTSPVHFLTNRSENGKEWISRGLPDDFFTPARRNFNLRDDVFQISSTYPVYESVPYGGVFGAKNYPYYECGPYDKGEWLVQKFKKVLELPVDKDNIKERKHTKMQLYNNVMYTHIPLQPDDPELQKLWLSSEVKYKIRVTRPYLRYTSRWYESPKEREKDFPNDFPDNHGFPVYQLSTRELAPTFHDTRLYQSILDNINIVPNPYYGSSFYERNPLETYVKITNLPTDLKNGAPVTINIFTVNGTLIRTLTKGDSETSYVNWDLKNHANIPIASGVYIIHVNCPGIGERMLKFFCTMRQTDLNTF